MGDKPKLDKRILLKRLANPESHQPIRITPEIKAGGERALAQAKQAHLDKVAKTDKNIADYCNDAASFVRNQIRGRVAIVPGLSEIFRRNYDLIDWGHKKRGRNVVQCNS